MNNIYKITCFILFSTICMCCKNSSNTESSTAINNVDSTSTASSDSLESHMIAEGCNQFPMHPPKASAFKLIPKNILLDPTNSITDISYIVNRKLLPALDSAGYEYSFYCMKDSGLAIITRIEKTNEDGTSDLKARYLSEEKYSKFSDYLLSLIRAKPGFYRVIVFIISPYKIIQSQNLLTKKGSDSLFESGSDRPYEDILTYNFSSRYQCTALIYQYKKANQEDGAKEIDPSPLTCIQHLTKANIWLNLSKNK